MRRSPRINVKQSSSSAVSPLVTHNQNATSQSFCEKKPTHIIAVDIMQNGIRQSPRVGSTVIKGKEENHSCDKSQNLDDTLSRPEGVFNGINGHNPCDINAVLLPHSDLNDPSKKRRLSCAQSPTDVASSSSKPPKMPCRQITPDSTNKNKVSATSPSKKTSKEKPEKRRSSFVRGRISAIPVLEDIDFSAAQRSITSPSNEEDAETLLCEGALKETLYKISSEFQDLPRLQEFETEVIHDIRLKLQKEEGEFDDPEMKKVKLEIIHAKSVVKSLKSEYDAWQTLLDDKKNDAQQAQRKELSVDRELITEPIGELDMDVQARLASLPDYNKCLEQIKNVRENSVLALDHFQKVKKCVEEFQQATNRFIMEQSKKAENEMFAEVQDYGDCKTIITNFLSIQDESTPSSS